MNEEKIRNWQKQLSIVNRNYSKLQKENARLKQENAELKEKLKK